MWILKDWFGIEGEQAVIKYKRTNIFVYSVRNWMQNSDYRLMSPSIEISSTINVNPIRNPSPSASVVADGVAVGVEEGLEVAVGVAVGVAVVVGVGVAVGVTVAVGIAVGVAVAVAVAVGVAVEVCSPAIVTVTDRWPATISLPWTVTV
mgnify:CR=1 FL=1